MVDVVSGSRPTTKRDNLMNYLQGSYDEDRLLELATGIVSGYVSNNPLPTSKLTKLIQKIHQTLVEISERNDMMATTQKPAVEVEKSITKEFLICLEDGKKLKMLKRHLRSKFGLTPDQYRTKWGLPKDYPMVAPGYALRRSELAKQIGLGKRNSYLTK